jgi:hypothetical protein
MVSDLIGIVHGGNRKRRRYLELDQDSPAGVGERACWRNLNSNLYSF